MQRQLRKTNTKKKGGRRGKQCVCVCVCSAHPVYNIQTISGTVSIIIRCQLCAHAQLTCFAMQYTLFSIQWRSLLEHFNFSRCYNIRLSLSSFRTFVRRCLSSSIFFHLQLQTKAVKISEESDEKKMFDTHTHRHR